jgi:hypothetical protein
MTSDRTQVAYPTRFLRSKDNRNGHFFCNYVHPEDGSTKCSDTQAHVYQNTRRHAEKTDLTLHHKARTNSDY